jgi:hypothetical protein
MLRRFVHLANGLWLALVLIGVPAATSITIGRLQLTSLSSSQMLILTGLSLGAGGNALTALWLGRRDKTGRLCWSWFFGFSLLLGIEYLYFNGHIDFKWLKDLLLWLKRQF